MTQARLDDILGGAVGHWAAEPHRVEAETTARFEVPGLDEALAVTRLPKDVRLLLRTLRAGMDSHTDGERDRTGAVRRLVSLGATPERGATRIHVLDAGDVHLVSRDGRRWQPCADTTPPAETEHAVRLLPDVLVEVTGDDTAGEVRRVTATLDAAATRGLVDVRRLLGAGADAAEASGTVGLLLGPDTLEIDLAVAVTASAAATGAVAIHSRTHLVRSRRELAPDLAIPEPSLSLPALASLHQALHLSPPPRRTGGGRRH